MATRSFGDNKQTRAKRADERAALEAALGRGGTLELSDEQARAEIRGDERYRPSQHTFERPSPSATRQRAKTPATSRPARAVPTLAEPERRPAKADDTGRSPQASRKLDSATLTAVVFTVVVGGGLALGVYLAFIR